MPSTNRARRAAITATSALIATIASGCNGPNGYVGFTSSHPRDRMNPQAAANLEHQVAVERQTVEIHRTQADLPDVIQLWSLDDRDTKKLAQKLEPPGYAIIGKVRCKDVQGDAILQTWTYLGDDGYFSRLLESQGPNATVTGTQDWRAFQIPFRIHDPEQAPSEIEFSIFMPAAGQVWIRDVRLVPLSKLPEADWPPAPQEAG